MIYRKRNTKYTAQGKSLTLAQWAKKLKVPTITFYRRFADSVRAGWTESEAIEYAVTRPRRKCNYGL